MKIPSEIRAGDSASWVDDSTSDNLGNTIDSTWTLKYDIRGTAALTLTAATQGSGWKTTITKVQSALLTAGLYFWQAYAEKGSDRVTVGSGQITILPNLSAASAGFDGRSQIAVDLDAVKAAIRAMINGGAVAEYTIAGRSMRKIPLSELIVLENKLKSELARERKQEMIANGLGNPSNVFVRFRK